MKRTYDYRMTDLNLEDLKESNTEDLDTDSSNAHLQFFMKRLEHFETYFDEREKSLFQSMCNFMKEFAFEQSALLTITETEAGGTFILDAPKFCLLDILSRDRNFLQYLENNVTYIEPSETGVRLEVHVSFVKKRRKNN